MANLFGEYILKVDSFIYPIFTLVSDSAFVGDDVFNSPELNSFFNRRYYIYINNSINITKPDILRCSIEV